MIRLTGILLEFDWIFCELMVAVKQKSCVKEIE